MSRRSCLSCAFICSLHCFLVCEPRNETPRVAFDLPHGSAEADVKPKQHYFFHNFDLQKVLLTSRRGRSAAPSEVVEQTPVPGVEFAVSLPAVMNPLGSYPVCGDCSASGPNDPTCLLQYAQEVVLVVCDRVVEVGGESVRYDNIVDNVNVTLFFGHKRLDKILSLCLLTGP